MLTTVKIKAINTPGRDADQNGLYLQVNKTGTKSRIYRYQINGKRREMGLGSLKQLSLKQARDAAFEAAKFKDQGTDPKTARDVQTEETLTNTRTFKECALSYIDEQKDGWKNAKHASQWENTLSQYAYPVIGNLPVDQITTPLVLNILKPIWKTKTETATRVRGRIENILSWAIVHGYREVPNPALWRGHLDMVLPQRNKVQKPKHHAALPYTDMPEFMAKIHQHKSLSSLALQFTILTAARTGEVIGATWGEIDLEKGIWNIPADRMKAEQEHRVPLSKEVIQILTALPSKEGFLFPSLRQGKHISNMAMLQFLKRDMHRKDLTVHGFRSTFRDWTAEQTHYPNEVCEAALAHTVKNKAEAAYRRGDMLEKRSALMQEWAEFAGYTTASDTPIKFK